MYKYSQAYDQRGSQMGRLNIVTEPDLKAKFHLEKVRLNGGGYDDGGAYWGVGKPLYIAYVWGTEEEQRIFVRASTRKQAKGEVKAWFKNARFFL